MTADVIIEFRRRPSVLAYMLRGLHPSPGMHGTGGDPAPQVAQLVVWPIGKTKGTPLADLTVPDLEKRREWCSDKDKRKYARLIRQIDEELRRRRSADIEQAS